MPSFAPLPLVGRSWNMRILLARHGETEWNTEGRYQGQGFDIPLLSGGATTSRVHTAVKIDPNYHRGQTVYVTDASRAVGVASNLLSKAAKPEFVANVRREYEEIARTHAAQRAPGRRVRRGTRSTGSCAVGGGELFSWLSAPDR